MAWLNRYGIDTTQLLPWDTMLAEYVLAGNRKWKLDLDSVAARYHQRQKGRLIDLMMKGGVCPSEMPRHLLIERVVGDVQAACGVFYGQRPALAEQNLTRVMFTRCITTPVLAHIEAEGMTLDHGAVLEMYYEFARKRAELDAQLEAMSGGINMRSRPQLAKFLYEDLGFAQLRDRRGEIRTTASGQPLTDTATLDSLKATTDKQKEFVKLRQEYGKVDAALSKNLEFFLGVCEERGGQFYGTFNQAVTATHRLSSSGKKLKFDLFPKPKSVQFQNLPRAMKKLFKARAEDRVISEADGAQLEFRVAGHCGKDEQVYIDATTGADIHRFTASIISNVSEFAVTPKQRTAAKKHTFKPLYGGQSGTKREVAYYEAFRAKYSGVFKTQTGWTMDVLRDGYLITATGLRFYWPDTRMDRSGYVTNTASIFNYPIQSLATAEIIPVSLVYTFWESRARGIDVSIINTVHDSVIADVAKKDVDRYRECVVDCFLDRTYAYMKAVYGIELFVPLGVGFKAGDHWGAGDETVTSYPYGEK